MADDVETPSRSRALLWIAALVFALPLLYVLSLGPVVWIFVRTKGFGGLVPVEPLEVFYSPVIWLDGHNDIFHHLLSDYVKLFGFP
jgi:hypothetical protein